MPQSVFLERDSTPQPLVASEDCVVGMERMTYQTVGGLIQKGTDYRRPHSRNSWIRPPSIVAPGVEEGGEAPGGVEEEDREAQEDDRNKLEEDREKREGVVAAVVVVRMEAP